MLLVVVGLARGWNGSVLVVVVLDVAEDEEEEDDDKNRCRCKDGRIVVAVGALGAWWTVVVPVTIGVVPVGVVVAVVVAWYPHVGHT